MSPLEIKILLHVYALVRDYRDEDGCTGTKMKAATETLEAFAGFGLIDKRCEDADWKSDNPKERASQYRVTEKGAAMVEHLCAVQIPVCKWVQPAGDAS